MPSLRRRSTFDSLFNPAVRIKPFPSAITRALSSGFVICVLSANITVRTDRADATLVDQRVRGASNSALTRFERRCTSFDGRNGNYGAHENASAVGKRSNIPGPSCQCHSSYTKHFRQGASRATHPTVSRAEWGARAVAAGTGCATGR